MAVEKQENAHNVRVTVRISIPLLTTAHLVGLEAEISKIALAFKDATYDLSIASPRPER